MKADDPIMIHARSARRVPWYLRVCVAAWCAIALAVTVYHMVGMRGLYGWLAYIQAEYIFSDAYYPTFTFLVALLALIGPPVLLLSLFGRNGIGEPQSAVSITAIVEDPTLLSDEPIRYGRARLLNRPDASVALRREGVAFERGDLSVFCPWALFADSSPPVVTADALLFSIDPERLDEVVVAKGGRTIERDGGVSTPFFRLRGGEQVEIHADYPGPLTELGEAIVSLSARRARRRR